VRAPKIAGFASLFLLNHKNVIQNTFKSSHFTPVGPAEKHRWAPGGKLGSGEHMWDPCRGELSHLSQHFWQMVLEGDGSTLGREGVSAVRAKTACSQPRTTETPSGGKIKRPQLGFCRAPSVGARTCVRPRPNGLQLYKTSVYQCPRWWVLAEIIAIIGGGC
jgi:hypothetical protein